MDALRDWGHARDYVEMQWLMLQQDQPDDFVIATGVQYTVRQFVEFTAGAMGTTIRWEGTGVEECGYVEAFDAEQTPGLEIGQKIVAVDPRYFRPAEVETLLGDPTKAKKKLGWVPETTCEEMVAEMVETDLAKAKQHALLKSHGYDVKVTRE